MTDVVDRLWSSLKPDAVGLVAAIVQHAGTAQVLMLGYMNREALAATLACGRVTFWSRSRSQLWEKGESSGNTLALVDARVDCDGDALLLRAQPAGPTCHTGTTSCFFTPVVAGERQPGDDGPRAVADRAIARVFATILDRKEGRGGTAAGGRSYVRGLLDKGVPKIAEKIREEANELCCALDSESDARVASEAADLFFHAMVGLAARGVDIEAVAAVFDARFGTSGLDEKASRATNPTE